MQIIQKIRDKGAAIGFIIIALSLIAFILMDAKQGSSRSSSGSTYIGKVNGEEIDYTQFSNEVQQQEARYGQQADKKINEIRQGVWDESVEKIVLQDEFTKLGLTFSPKEMSSILFSNNAPDELKQNKNFINPATGQYDIAKAEAWWPTVKKSSDEEKAQVETLIEGMKLRALYGKYSAMVAASVYSPTWLQQKEETERKKIANISYVAVPYSVINDNSIQVSSDEIADYVKNHAAAYKQDGGRYISYVSFNAGPSAADTAAVIKNIEGLKEKFTIDTSAKAFLDKNGSEIKYSDDYIYKSKITGSEKDSITALPVSKVFGPYLDGSNIVLAKKTEEKLIPDTVKCRHILIKTVDEKGQTILDDNTAKKLIDSIAAAIKGGANFNSLVLKYSGDSGSINKGGEYTFGYSDFHSIMKEFSEAIFYGKTGDKKVVHTAYGWHYIEVLDQKNIQPAYQVAYMAAAITPSQETVDAASSQATQLVSNTQDLKSLDVYVAKNGLVKINVPTLLTSADYQLDNMENARPLIKWAFDAKEGSISDPFPIGDKFIVGVLDRIVPEGLPDTATARPLVEKLILNLKKADQIITQLGTNPSLESAAKAYNGSIQTAGSDSSLTFNAPLINGLGQEPILIGATFNNDLLGKVSSPIAGANGVYVLKVNSVSDKSADLPTIAAQQKTQLLKATQQELLYGWLESLRKQADVKDNRSKYL